MRITKLRMLKFPTSSYKTDLPPLPEVSDLLKLYRVRATKHLSQNFIYDPQILERFAACIKRGSLKGEYLCEIGPGPGTITRELIRRNPEQLTVVEKDHRFMPMLKYLSHMCGGDEKMSIVHGDILQFDMRQAFPKQLATDWQEDSPPFHICGNLPFNVSLQLLFQLLQQISTKQDLFSLGRVPMTFTFQHEVGQRLVAPPGDEQRSRMSACIQMFCDVKYEFVMRGGSFVPPPKVDVAVVKIVPKRSFIIDLPFKRVDYVVKHVMHNRNKNCLQGVRTLFPRARDDLVEEMFRTSQVDRKRVGRDLRNAEMRDLCYAYEEIAERIPQLRLVDCFDTKPWLKHFDSSGQPLR